VPDAEETSPYSQYRKIDAGGQGEVWECLDNNFESVAVKYLFLIGDEESQLADRRRFQREVTCQSSLDHPGILPVISIHLEGARPHFAMPLASGSLRQRIPLGASPAVGLPDDDVWTVFNEVLDAVGYAHSSGVIHRDLKPENILFFKGRAVLSDFGLGRRLFSDSTTLTMTNVGMGTFAYCAPEQLANAKEADSRADIFALGRILYEMLTGELAIVGMDLNKVPAKYRFIVNKATQPDPERRFQSVDDMQREFALLRDDASELMTPADRATRLITEIASGHAAKIDDLQRLVMENDGDLQLFIQVVPMVPESVLAQMALRDPEQYYSIMQVFDQFADGGFGFDFTDTIARFLVAAYRASNDQRVHQLIIARLLVLGATHNRWFVRDRFIEVVRGALAQPHYAPLVAAALRDNPWAVDFVSAHLNELSLPSVVRDALQAVA
jgi:eukaryotic-like serine/threonine-protein kinase